MNVIHIPVEYPLTIKKVVKTEAEMRALGYKNHKGDQTTNVFVNRPFHIRVRQVARLVQEEFMNSADYEAELEAKCKEQTGMSRAAYQVRYRRAWNE